MSKSAQASKESVTGTVRPTGDGGHEVVFRLGSDVIEAARAGAPAATDEVLSPCGWVVRWDGEIHHFEEEKQRAVVRMLLAARAAGREWMNGKYLLAEADCDITAELRDVFKKHKTWRRLIQSAAELADGPVGAFRIRPPRV